MPERDGLPITTTQPDPRRVRRGWLAWFAWPFLAGALLLQDLRGGVLTLALVLSAPFWLLWFFWPLYRLRTRWHVGRGEWQGRYYEFDGQQIRVLADGDALRYVADDVFDALQIEPDARRIERVRQIVGRDGLAAEPTHQRLCFSDRGLDAWLERRSDRAAVAFRHWLHSQVREPYRRRREMLDE